MVAATEVQMVNISINDIPLQVPKGEMIVESVKRLGLEVPIFCYHSRMKPVGMCRMCLIEIGFKQPDGSVRKMPKPQTACTLPASEGLQVYTDTQAIHTDRKGVLEFLLINHPLDCPICDRGGECPLQNNTLFYGPSTSRFVEFKRHAPKAFPLSKYVTLDLERCIQCGRCVRFTEEISGDAQLALRFRGSKTQPGTFELRDFDSKFSGNVIEICPVGALTSSKYRFRARPWDLQTRPGICTLCSNGCNIHVDYRLDQIVRVNGRTNEAVNEEWTCDKGKFGHFDFNGEGRLGKTLVRKNGGLTPTVWADAYEEVLGALRGVKPTEIAVLAGSQNSNEDLYLLRQLFQGTLGTFNLDHRFTKFLPQDPALSQARTPIADFEQAPSILVFGSSLADELPILFLRVRKAWFKNGVKVIVAHDAPTDADSFAHAVLHYRPGTGHLLATGLAGLAQEAPGITVEGVANETGVSIKSLQSAVAALANPATVTTRSIFNSVHGEATAMALKTFSEYREGVFNNYSLGANEEGALRLGIQPESAPPSGLNSHEILAGCINGTIKVLWLAGVDPLAAFNDSSLVHRALESVDYLIYQHYKSSDSLPYASVVLPMTAPSEADGSYTNMEGRVQRFGQVLAPKGEAKPAWRVFSELGMRIRPQVPPFNAGDVMLRISNEYPAFAEIKYANLTGEGLLLRH